MESTPLHAQKVTILSRLIKESSLTLEEALVLLKEEEEIEETVISQPSYIPGTTSPWIQPYHTPGTVPLTGSPLTGFGTLSGNTFAVTTTGNTTSTTLLTSNTPSTLTADLNN